MNTTGRELAAMLRKNFRIGTRTRRYRKGEDLFASMLEALSNATTYPGYYTGRKHEVFTAARAVQLAYAKHVQGHRISGTLQFWISQRSPWQLANLLGEMLDAGVTNSYEGEQFFRTLTKRAAQN